MGTFTGRNGKVLAGASTILDITKWEFNENSITHRYCSSSTSGFKATVAGAFEGDGNIDYKSQQTIALVGLAIGQAVTLKLYEDATYFWLVPAVVKSVKHMCDIDNGDIVGGSATFETNGQWTPPVRPTA